MRKRKPSLGSEIEVEEDSEEKMDLQEDPDRSDEDDDEEMKDPEDEDEDDDDEDDGPNTAVPDNPFMDSFYGLSSANPKERAQAAQIMLQHCLLGPTANTKDAAYAFRRLLSGICSGRAAARQGNASALATFLKVAFRMEGDDSTDELHTNKMHDIRAVADLATSTATDSSEEDDDEEQDDSLLSYVRRRLLDATDPRRTSGKKKGSEERDYHFGRLFGILAIVRSHILLPSKNSGTEEQEGKKQIAAALATDLIDLFWMKKWMREPAAHGITTMLKLYMDRQSYKGCNEIAWSLVEDTIIPNILRLKSENQEEEMDRDALIPSFCAEQFGIAMFIQSQACKKESQINLPTPLDEPIISTDSIASISDALAETSSVVHPRTHFVWDSLVCFLTEEVQQTKNDSTRAIVRQLRDFVPGGSDRVSDIIDSIFSIVVKKKLIRIHEDSTGSKGTHERRSLALCLVRNFSGATFVSSISGPTVIQMYSEATESILLSPELIRALFLSVIPAGRTKNSVPHLLKPLATEVLGSIIESTVESKDFQRQLSVAKALINCDVRFDAHTKTSAVSDLLHFNENLVPTNEHVRLWNDYVDFLESQFLQCCKSMTDASDSGKANGHIELLLAAAKGVLRSWSSDAQEAQQEQSMKMEGIVSRVLHLLMTTAFFDCSSVAVASSTPQEKSKKKKRKSSSKNSASVVHPAVGSGLKIHNTIGANVAYPVRAIASARFFALLSEFTITSSRRSGDDKDDKKAEKDNTVVKILGRICDAWKELETSGARRHGTSSDDKAHGDEGDSPIAVLKTLRERHSNLCDNDAMSGDSELGELKRRLCGGVTGLAMAVFIHRLTPGTSDGFDEDPDEDEEDDEEEICAALAGMRTIVEEFENSEGEEDNPLLSLAEMCANILSSPLGSGNLGRGSAPRLIRETVKYAWLGGLRFSSAMATEDKTLLDASVVAVLMEAIGANEDGNARGNDMEEDYEEDEDQSDMDDEDGDDDHSDTNDGRIFSKASQLSIDDNSDDESPSLSRKFKNDDGDSDIEVDPAKLHEMLEEDSDADVDENVLEHHEGADAALAKLIKLKQDARKAGQQAREAAEISNHLRCTFLLELLLSRPDGWNKLFRTDIVLKMVHPWLHHRKAVSLLVQKAVESGAKIGTGDKKALLERLTILLKQKLCKLRLSSMPFGSDVDKSQANDLISHLTSEALKSKDKDHISCCSSCMLFVLRTLSPSPETTATASSAYGQVVCDWSTKRTSGESLLTDLITHNLLLAQAALSAPLSQATQDARSPFLKLQAYKLLALLFAGKPNTDKDSLSDMEKISAVKIHESQKDLLSSIQSSISDEQMATPKRARVILKTVEKFLPFLSNPVPSDNINGVRDAIKNIGREDNQGLESASKKLIEMIDERIKALNNDSASSSTGKPPSSVTGEAEEGITTDTANNNNQSSKSNKKKKKKKKR